MIFPNYAYTGGSLEQDVAEWVEDIAMFGYVTMWDGSPGPTREAIDCERLPWGEGVHADPRSGVVLLLMQMGPRSLAYWFFGPSNFRHVHMPAAAETN